jgi:hypothetical protein
MAAISPNETAKIIRDLLRIAKVAMPGHLYDEDPRVLVARAALRELETNSSTGRPPNVTSRSPALDVAKLAPNRSVEMSSTGISFVFDVPWDLVDALHDAQADFAWLDTSETVGFALRDWLTGHGYLQAESEPQ